MVLTLSLAEKSAIRGILTSYSTWQSQIASRPTRVVKELFAAYFENEKDITSYDVLADAGVNAGLNTAEVKEWLDSGKGGPEVDKEVQEAYQQSIFGVPNFIIQD